MSINDINNAAAAMNQLKTRYEGFLDDADDQIAARQAAYDGLAGNLLGVVRGELDFSGTVDPDNANPTGVNGGTFNTVRALIDATPKGGLVRIKLVAGKTHYLDENVSLGGRKVFIERTGVGDRPVFMPVVTASGGSNQVKRFTEADGGMLSIIDVNLSMPPKADEALPWNGFAYCFLENYQSPVLAVRLSSVKFTTDAGGAVVTANRGTIVSLSMNNVTLDGPGFGVSHIGDWGVAVIAKQAVTLLNGAALQSGGTVGTDILQNGG